MNKIILISMMFVSTASFAITDTGTISQLYVDASGEIAIKLKEGFSNSSNLCANYSGWAGITIDSPELKSALLAAKVSQSTVDISITKCNETHGSWLNIDSVYIK
ncbi:MAG: hypothetical protein ACI8SR_002950 [Oceanicoccus sp.]|jgi:hypothetical protein